MLGIDLSLKISSAGLMERQSQTASGSRSMGFMGRQTLTTMYRSFRRRWASASSVMTRRRSEGAEAWVKSVWTPWEGELAVLIRLLLRFP